MKSLIMSKEQSITEIRLKYVGQLGFAKGSSS